MRAGRIVGDHAAHRGALGRSRIGAKHQSMLRRGGIQLREDHARFDNCRLRLRVDIDDGVQPPGTVQDEAMSNRLTCQTCPGPTRQNWDVKPGSQLHRCVQILLRFGKHDSEGLHLIDGCIGAVKDARSKIVPDLSPKISLKLVYVIQRQRHDSILTQRPVWLFRAVSGMKTAGIRNAALPDNRRCLRRQR